MIKKCNKSRNTKPKVLTGFQSCISTLVPKKEISFNNSRPNDRISQTTHKNTLNTNIKLCLFQNKYHTLLAYQQSDKNSNYMFDQKLNVKNRIVSLLAVDNTCNQVLAHSCFVILAYLAAHEVTSSFSYKNGVGLKTLPKVENA